MKCLYYLPYLLYGLYIVPSIGFAFKYSFSNFNSLARLDLDNANNTKKLKCTNITKKGQKSNELNRGERQCSEMLPGQVLALPQAWSEFTIDIL